MPQGNNSTAPQSNPDMYVDVTPSTLETVLPLAGIVPSPGVKIPSDEPWRELMSFRANFPHVPIMPAPHFTRTALLVANTPVDINLPENASIIMFCAPQSGGLVAFSLQQRAPNFTGADMEQFNDTIIIGPSTPPYPYYIKNTRQVSASCNVAGPTFVQIFGWITKNEC